MVYIPDAVRQEVIERAGERCEYCQTQMAIVVTMEIDHIVPLTVGSATALDNLCLACAMCNGSKQDYRSGIDPETAQHAPLFNPRFQKWREHFHWSTDGLYIVGLTSTGRATIARLRMNRETMVKARQRWVAAGWHPPADGA